MCFSENLTEDLLGLAGSIREMIQIPEEYNQR